MEIGSSIQRSGSISILENNEFTVIQYAQFHSNNRNASEKCEFLCIQNSPCAYFEYNSESFECWLFSDPLQSFNMTQSTIHDVKYFPCRSNHSTPGFNICVLSFSNFEFVAMLFVSITCQKAMVDYSIGMVR